MIWLLRYNDLIWNLTVSDLKIKYQSSALGFIWSLLNPFLMMVVLYAVFSNVFKMNQENFALYILVGIISWRFFQTGTTVAMGSIVGKSNLVSKIFIPRQILVLSSTLSCFISSTLEFCVLIPLLLFLGGQITPYILLFPILHVIFFFFIYGLSLILAALYVYYRDLNQIWEVLIQLGFFLSPICYPLSTVPTKYLPFYLLNPITVLIDNYRNILIYGINPSLLGVLYLTFTALIFMIMGSIIFKHLQKKFAEAL